MSWSLFSDAIQNLPINYLQSYSGWRIEFADTGNIRFFSCAQKDPAHGQSCFCILR